MWVGNMKTAAGIEPVSCIVVDSIAYHQAMAPIGQSIV